MLRTEVFYERDQAARHERLRIGVFSYDTQTLQIVCSDG